MAKANYHQSTSRTGSAEKGHVLENPKNLLRLHDISQSQRLAKPFLESVRAGLRDGLDSTLAIEPVIP